MICNIHIQTSKTYRCPPCRQFTPMLVKHYHNIWRDYSDPKIEIIFVSSDKDEKSFNSYFNTMPWSSLKFQSDAGRRLSQEFGVRGIPTLVILDQKTGKVLTKNGRALVMQYGDEFAKMSTDSGVLEKINAPLESQFLTIRTVLIAVFAMFAALYMNGNIKF